jgi:hypothetical protein
MGRHHTKTDVVVEVVEVVDIVIVAASTARVLIVVVEGAAAQHTGVNQPAPSQNATHSLYAEKL